MKLGYDNILGIAHALIILDLILCNLRYWQSR